MKKTFILNLFSTFFLCVVMTCSFAYAKNNQIEEKQPTKIDYEDLTPVEYFCQVCGDCPTRDDEKLWEEYEQKYPMKKYNQCLDKPIIGDYDISECAWEEIERQEVLLNQKYKKLMITLPKNQKIALRNYQQQWIKERDKKYECIGYTGGTMDYVNQSSFYLHETIKRIDEFDQCLSAKKISRNSKGCEHLYPLK